METKSNNLYKETIIYDYKHIYDNVNLLNDNNLKEEELRNAMINIIIAAMIAKVIKTEYVIDVKDYVNMVVVLNSINVDTNTLDYISKDIYNSIGSVLNKYRENGNFMDISIKDKHLAILHIY